MFNQNPLYSYSSFFFEEDTRENRDTRNLFDRTVKEESSESRWSGTSRRSVEGAARGHHHLSHFTIGATPFDDRYPEPSVTSNFHRGIKKERGILLAAAR